MSDVAIRIHELGKRYRLGEGGTAKFRYKSLRDSLAAPFVRSTAHRRSQLETSLWALRNVSFEVNRGEVVGIIGRNGAGKSTLLKILSRITEPTEGWADVSGRLGSLLEVGTGFHPELTGRENIFLNGAVLGMKRAEIAGNFDAIVAFAEVEKFLDTPVKHYSSGMAVRLAFAVAAHLQPEILLIDEVLAVGDAEFQKKCLGKMGSVAREGRTVLFVSHNMGSLQNLCTRGILLDAGKVALDGHIHQVTERYLESSRSEAGEVRWDAPATAPGDDRVRLQAVRVVSGGAATGEVDIKQGFRIEVDYVNLKPDGKRLVSIHLHNSAGVCVLASANFPSASHVGDEWYNRPQPAGRFRTGCGFPGRLLNAGTYVVTVYVLGGTFRDVPIAVKDALTFRINDTGFMNAEYTGEWKGIIRIPLDWKSEYHGR